MTTISDKKMEARIKDLENTMATIVKALKGLGASVKALEEKANKSQNEDIQEILKSQDKLEGIIIANSKAIKQIDEEILRLQTSKTRADTTKTKNNEAKIEVKKCRYFNRGHCKYKLECRFSHPTEICSKILEGRKCEQHLCKMRHPKSCKWDQRGSGCRRKDCDYLHGTLAHDDAQQTRAHKNYPCAGCKNCYEDQTCVVQHTAKSKVFFLCLNCEDWIRRKDMVLNPGWSLYDLNGDLRTDV